MSVWKVLHCFSIVILNSSPPNAFTVLIDYTALWVTDSSRVLLVEVTSITRGTASEFTLLGLIYFAWSTRFLKPAFIFVAQLMLLIDFATWWPSLNSEIISSRIRQWCTFIYVAFKSHMKRSEAERVGGPSSTILPTIVGTLNFFGYMTFALQIRSYQNIATFFTHPIMSFNSTIGFREINGLVIGHIRCISTQNVKMLSEFTFLEFDDLWVSRIKIKWTKLQKS